MPAIVKVKVLAARDLPVMDRSSDSTDCFVEIRLGQTVNRTEVCRKNLNPVWDSQWFSYNVNDDELQDEPLMFKVMDHDQYSAHDAIGRVYISLDAVVFSVSSSLPSLEGWFPIYDTLHGIRGEVHIKIIIEMIKDQHRFKHSSNELMLFSGQEIPEGYSLVAIQGFLEELVVNDDPEYQWIDKIRPPRASNESRQQVFLKLSGELQRKIGIKALEVGGNAIIGYSQCFDLEGESGIVVRGIGTSVTLRHILQSVPSSSTYLDHSENSMNFNNLTEKQLEDEATSTLVDQSRITPPPEDGTDLPKLHIPRLRQLSSSESECPPSSPTRAGFGVESTMLLGTSAGSGGHNIPHPLDLMSTTSEFPFYTLSSFPPGFIKSIAGIVAAHSVKLLDEINNPDEPETRDAWWKEIRHEIKSHSCAMCCDAVIGYSETTSICDGLCIFTATGTAVAIGNKDNNDIHLDSPSGGGTNPKTFPQTPTAAEVSALLGGGGGGEGQPISPISVGDDKGGIEKEDIVQISVEDSPQCGPCHIVYSSLKCPFDIKLTPCAVCRVKQVPSLLLSTSALPPGLLVRGVGCLIQARVCKPKKRWKGEDSASNVSSMLPFVEYSLHGRLLNKLKLRGMNALFGIKVEITVGDTMIVGVATGNGVFLEALPPPGKLVAPIIDPTTVSSHSIDIQSSLDQLLEENKQRYALNKSKVLSDDEEILDGLISPKTVSPETELNELDLNFGKEKAVMIEVDEHHLKDEDINDLFMDHAFPKGFYISNLSFVPGISEKFLTDQSKVVSFVSKQTIDGRQDQQFTSFMNKTLQGLLFRVRTIYPCMLSNVSFEVDLPDDDEVQVTVVAIATRMRSDWSEASKSSSSHSINPQQLPPFLSEELMFTMEGGSEGPCVSRNSVVSTISNEELSPPKSFMLSPRPKVLGYTCTRYLGAINLFLIRETTSIKELGGMNSFLHTFISEAHSLARAHVLSLGGHALINYQLRQCIVMEHHHKNQGQCLLNLTGDATQLQKDESNLISSDRFQPLELSDLSESPTLVYRKRLKKSNESPKLSGTDTHLTITSTPYQISAC